MIFISHNHNDKPLIEGIALRIANVYGQDNVFYDSWSMQPGDGIINEMNHGLEDCKFFFFFMTKNSLQSSMVKMEWQNALMKSIKGDCKFIAVKIDSSLIPPILMQSIYIDIFGQGLEIGIRQMIDVINGKNNFSPNKRIYHNIRATIRWDHKSKTKCSIFFEAELYFEPMAKFLIFFSNPIADLVFQSPTDSLRMTGSFEKIDLLDGSPHNVQLEEIQRGLSPGFHFTVDVSSTTAKSIEILGLMRAIKHNEYIKIPYIDEGITV